MILENFKKNDYIVSPASGDMAIYDKVDKSGYMHFKEYYSNMLKSFKDVKKYPLQINYQKFFRLCSKDEKDLLDNLLKNKNTTNQFI